MFKIYECIIDDGTALYKEYIPSPSKSALLNQWGGNGEFIRIKDVTKDFPIGEACLTEALQQYGFGQIEQDIIRRALQNTIGLV